MESTQSEQAELIPIFFDIIVGLIELGTAIGHMFGGCTVDGPSYEVEIKNFGDKLLIFYDAYMPAGDIITPPVSIPPGGGDIFAGNNGGYAKFGTYGCIAWEIEDTGYMLVLYIYMPLAFTSYVNWLGFGIFKTQTLTGSYHTIYNYFKWENGPKNTNYVIKRFYENSDPLEFTQNKDYYVRGTMTDAHKGPIYVSII